MKDIRDFNPSELVPDGQVLEEGERFIPEEAYKNLNPVEHVLTAAQEGYCSAHGCIFPATYNQATAPHGTGDVFLNALIVGLVEALEDCEEDELEAVRQRSISYLEDSIEMLQEAVAGVRVYGRSV